MPARRILDWLAGEEGQDIVEWAMLAAFVAIAVLLILLMFHDPLWGLYQGVLGRLQFMNAHL